MDDGRSTMDDLRFYQYRVRQSWHPSHVRQGGLRFLWSSIRADEHLHGHTALAEIYRSLVSAKPGVAQRGREELGALGRFEDPNLNDVGPISGRLDTFVQHREKGTFRRDGQSRRGNHELK